MRCPHCKTDSFIELESREPRDYPDLGWSINECQNCHYKVRYKTLDGRRVGIDWVIRKPVLKAEGKEETNEHTG